MALGKFYFLHGAVLAKIVRREKPVALTLIETKDDSWSVYRLNDEISLCIKSSQSPKRFIRNRMIKWQFTFSSSDVGKLKDSGTSSYLALVCAGKTLDDKYREICLLEPTQIRRCIDSSTDGNQWIAVELSPGNSLRAYGPLNSQEKDKLIIPRKSLDDWEIPGS